ncbi:hypothetical protein [Corynebacterium anserum]|uniref:Uncharacterized protein n=1 Tax=Corynebacterium anserum TaxID=2684406 RepID=A0A7G7YPP5_9CORY|nr:hypothetical protein [Corynebacterium anserum]QNH96465.1 hypothetical protein GP473_07175 [Corynebacterium anserum]
MSSEYPNGPQSSQKQSAQREEPTTASASVSPAQSPRGEGFRFVAVFAAAGLLLAGLVGVWTLKASNGDPDARQRAISEQSLLDKSEDSSASETNKRTDTSGKAKTNTSAHKAHTAQPGYASGEGTQNVTPLGNDPYLPPNSWNGGSRNDASEAPISPTETLFSVPTSETTAVAPPSGSKPSKPTTPAAPKPPAPVFPAPSIPLKLDFFPGGTVAPTATMTQLPSDSKSSNEKAQTAHSGKSAPAASKDSKGEAGNTTNQLTIFERPVWGGMTDTR